MKSTDRCEENSQVDREAEGLGAFFAAQHNQLLTLPWFAQGRSDNGIAKVHGIIDGQYVAGDVRIKRIAKYHPRTGVWTGRGPVADSCPHWKSWCDLLRLPGHPPSLLITHYLPYAHQAHPVGRNSTGCPRVPCPTPWRGPSPMLWILAGWALAVLTQRKT